MELNRWIEMVAGTRKGERAGIQALEPVARLLGENSRTVYTWYRGDRIPRFRSALNIVIASKGVVDYNGIFGSFGKALVDVPGATDAEV